MNYIIDGYNLAYNISDIANHLKSGNLNIAVHQLTIFLNKTLKGQKKKIILVLDGNPFSSEQANAHDKIKILYSKKPQTADDIIRNFIRKTKNINQWTVVSSDTEILYTALDHGANTIKSADFVKKTITHEEHISAELDAKSNPQNIDVQYWKDIFEKEKDK